ncbi:hypothetical protein FOXG_04547 [Fusarium oxysporum f. sp. lycopersici 4287]|uniref:Agmatinase n=2 Tax=Fusarium oxysporum TaxID=5507 RepID=A0A0J9UPR6_FUSO4|nr:hypothetical protein FOXG_04547 [Fusarium oxysporum f. sp. lycopersici 4287]KNB01270.1 hypothetical protein FOXG_04547 [Fusarium oxysporum f. sp. lycopersici 4287]
MSIVGQGDWDTEACTRLDMNCSGPIIRLRWSQKHQARPDNRLQKRTTHTKQSLQPSTTRHSNITGQPEATPLDSNLSSVFDPAAVDGNYALSPSHGGDGWIDEAFGDMMPELMSFGLIPNATATSIQTPELLQMAEEFGPTIETAGLSPKEPIHPEGEISASPITSLPIDTNRPQSVSSQPVQVAGAPRPYISTVVDRPLNDYSTILVEYYFKDTAAILALYDSEMNPFRSTVSRALIALFMIGGTASWFDINDTGSEYFPRLKKHVQSLKTSGRMAPTGQSQAFFENTLACWEMFLAFVVDGDENEVFDSPHLPLLPADPDPEPRSIFPVVQIPHPVTGVAHEIHTTLARVGRLVRRNRRRAMSKQFLTRESILEAHREVDEAAELEIFLTNLQVPLESAIVQTGDSQTPTWHLTALAEVYRFVGLIQLYHVFPDTLVSRVSLQNSHAGGDVAQASAHEAEERLRQFTLKAVEILRSIPAESGTKDFHPFLIVAVCSGLTIPIVEVSASPQAMAGLENSLALVVADVHRARGFLRVLPLAGLTIGCNHHHDDKKWSAEELAELEAKWGFDWAFGGIGTFAHLNHVKCLTEPTEPYDIAIIGAPFDTAVTYRPGARFGPRSIRHASGRQHSLRGYNPRADINPYQNWAKIVDCGDIPITPIDNDIAQKQMTQALEQLGMRKTVSSISSKPKLFTLGGDHSLTLPALRALKKVYGDREIQVLHFDAHLDTWNPHAYPSYWGTTPFNHGSMFWLANQEGLLSNSSSHPSVHAGLRTRLTGIQDNEDDTAQNWIRFSADDIDKIGTQGIIGGIMKLLGTENLVYLSVDIDVLDPAFAPGTGTPEPGGWSTREFINILRGIEDLNLVGADVVEVSPVYQGAGEETTFAAAQVVYEILTSMVKRGLQDLGRSDKATIGEGVAG